MSPEALKKAEDLISGFEDCKLTAYQDQRGRWTCGWGSTGPDIGPGTVWTQTQADERRDNAIISLARGVEASLGRVFAKLSSDQLAAAISFAYNVGFAEFKRSGFLRFLLQEQPYQAGLNLLLWNEVGHYFNFGLYRRRCEELLFGWPTVARQIGVAE